MPWKSLSISDNYHHLQVWGRNIAKAHASAMLEFLLWFDAAPWRYWLLGWLSFAACVALAWRPWVKDGAPAARGSAFSYLALLLLWLFVFRWPWLIYPESLGVDESQMIAAATTFEHDPVPWRSVDTQTVGPLHVYALFVAKLLVGEHSQFGARLLVVMLTAAIVALNYLGMRRFFSERSARLSSLLLVSCCAFTAQAGFLYYSNAYVTIFLIAVGLYALLRALDGGSVGWLWVSGLALGAVPFAKLHGAPLALWIGLAGIARLLSEDSTGSRRTRRLGALVGGALVVPLLFAISLTFFELWEVFFYSYFNGGVSYIAKGGRARMGVNILLIGLQLDSFGRLWIAIVLVAILAAFARRKLEGLQGWCQTVAWGGLVIAVGIILIPLRRYDHYFVFLLPILSLVAGVALARLDTARAWMRRTAWVILISVGVGLPAAERAYTGIAQVGRFAHNWSTPNGAPDPLVGELLRWTEPGEPLAHWGYEDTLLYVRTGCRQATCESNTARLTGVATRERDFFRARYFAGLQKSRPRVFVDASPRLPREYGFDDWPELQAYIAEHYRLYGEFDRRRLYLRRDVTHEGN